MASSERGAEGKRRNNRYEYEAEKRDALTEWDARLAQIEQSPPVL
jgi:hypothetical protein